MKYKLKAIYFLFFLAWYFLFGLKGFSETIDAVKFFQEGRRFEERFLRENAVSSYQMALKSITEKERILEPEIKLRLGANLTRTGRYTQGFPFLFEAIDHFASQGDFFLAGYGEFELGFEYEELNEISLARVHYQMAKSYFQRSGNRIQEAETIQRQSKISLFEEGINGSFEQCLALANQALTIQNEEGDIRGQANTIHHLGYVDLLRGRFLSSEKKISRAATLMRMTNDVEGLVTIYESWGNVLESLNRFPEALEKYQFAQESAQRSGNPYLIGSDLNWIGQYYRKLKKYDKALEYFKASEEICLKLGNFWAMSIISNSVGDTYRKLGNHSKMEETHERSLSYIKSTGLYEQAAYNYYKYAYNETFFNHWEKSILLMENALNVLEKLRLELKTEEEKNIFFAQKQFYYRFLVSILTRRGAEVIGPESITSAFNVSETARARSFLDQVTREKVLLRKFSSPSLLEQEGRILGHLDQLRYVEIEKRAGDGRQQQQLEVDLLKVRQKILSNYKENPIPPTLTLSEIQDRVLDEDTVAVQYFLDEEGSHVFVVGKNCIHYHRLEKKSEIDRVATEYSNLLSGRPGSTKQIEESARKLSDLVISPLEEDLKKPKVVFLPDGKLHLVPFPALLLSNRGFDSSKRTYLIEKFEIVVADSLSSLQALRTQGESPRQSPLKIAVFANPVFSSLDSRIQPGNRRNVKNNHFPQAQSSDTKLESLLAELVEVPETGIQAKLLRELFGPSRCRVFEGFEANKSNARNPDLRGYGVIHFATHSRIDPENPDFTGLALSMFDESGASVDGFLISSEIRQLKLDSTLVFLSACETATGKRQEGEGVLGLARSFRFAGAKCVIATLWKIGEKTSGDFALCFYRHLENDSNGNQILKAIRATQLEMINGGNPSFRNPQKWAAYQVYGDWR